MTKKAASVFVQTLKNHGVNRFFCVPGESYLSVMDELLYSPGIDVITCRHEGGAGFMAVADAKCTGKAGVAFVSSCLLYTSPSPRDLSTSRMPSSA